MKYQQGQLFKRHGGSYFLFFPGVDFLADFFFTEAFRAVLTTGFLEGFLAVFLAATDFFLRAGAAFFFAAFLMAFFTSFIFSEAAATSLSLPSTISSPRTLNASPARVKKPFSWEAGAFSFLV